MLGLYSLYSLYIYIYTPLLKGLLPLYKLRAVQEIVSTLVDSSETLSIMESFF